MNKTHGSLFSGFDAPSVAASWMGWKNAFHCEINSFCNEILKYWFPDSEHYEDITKTDFSQWKGRIDVLTGGFPCQPFSLAGQRKGADDNRYLWPEMLRAIREIRPTWVIGENVAGILTMVQSGEETEMGSQTALFGEDNRKRVLLRQEYVVETICKDLEREGYSVQPLLIPACAVGAPHRRDRVWFVARLITDTACRGSGGTPYESCRENERQDGYETQQPIFRGYVRTASDSQCPRGRQVHQEIQPESQMGTALTAMAMNGMLPTPTARSYKNGSKPEDGRTKRKIEQGWTMELNDLAACGMLPTPTTNDYKGASTLEALEKRRRNPATNSLADRFSQTGKTSQLNPLFVEEMMGFPLMWTTLPFLSQNGDRNQSKDMEMP